MRLIFSFSNQNEPANRLLFGNMDAMDSMLQQLAYYKRHDPAVAEEVAQTDFPPCLILFFSPG